MVKIGHKRRGELEVIDLPPHTLIKDIEESKVIPYMKLKFRNPLDELKEV